MPLYKNPLEMFFVFLTIITGIFLKNFMAFGLYLFLSSSYAKIIIVYSGEMCRIWLLGVLFVGEKIERFYGKPFISEQNVFETKQKVRYY